MLNVSHASWRKCIHGLLLLLMFLSTLTACKLPSAKHPEVQQAVTAFYQAYVDLRPSGVPSANELQKFQPYLSAPLSTLLQEADLAEQKYYKANKGEVPPLVEGDLFTSMFEGASTFSVLSCESQGDAGFCTVQFTYIDPSDKSSHRWKDKAFVVKDAAGWRLDDIEYGGTWEFMHKGRLQGVLRQVIKDGNSA